MSADRFKPQTNEVSKEQADSDVATNLNENPNYGIISKKPDYDAKLNRPKTHLKSAEEGRHVVIICCFDPRTDPAAELVLKRIHCEYG